jgi:hypothetical protein
MTGQIHSIVFYAPQVLLDAGGEAVPLMEALVSELAASRRVVAVCPDDACGVRVRELYGESLTAVHVEDATSATGRGTAKPDETHGSFIAGLRAAGVLDDTTTLYVDHHPRRCMAAVRSGVPAGIFEDAARLYRDLGLWGLVPLDHSLEGVRAHLSR